MLVKDIMTIDPVVCPAHTSVREAAGLLKKHHIGSLPVMDGQNLVGIITESDIISLLKTEDISDDLWLPSPLEIIELPIREVINWEKTKHALSNIGETEVKDVMSHPVITVTEDVDIEEAASIMISEKIARLPVVRNGQLVGIVTRADIVDGVGTSYAAQTEQENTL